MSTEENKAVARRFLNEIFNKGNFDYADEVYDENVIAHTPFGDIKGRDGLKQFNMLIKAFPDIVMTIEDQVAEGDKVVNRFTFTGTHEGEFMGIAPTGKSFKFSGINIQVIVDGKFIEGWSVMDILSLDQQLGAISLPGQK
jgi:predicted ester cyclase